MIDHILVAVGGEEMDAESIAEHVAEIAAGVGATVTLFRAFPEEEFNKWLNEMGYDSSQPEELAQRHNVVNTMADILQAANVDFHVDAEVGPPADMVIEFARRKGVDHVFLGGRRRSPTGKAILGSVSNRVLLNIDIPCTVMFNK